MGPIVVCSATEPWAQQPDGTYGTHGTNVSDPISPICHIVHRFAAARAAIRRYAHILHAAMRPPSSKLLTAYFGRSTSCRRFAFCGR